jgi:hypothetical protein
MSPGPIAYAATKGVVDTLVKHFAAESGSALAACSSCAGELAAKHGHAALRLLSGGLVLKDIPVLYEHAIGNADDVGCDPVPWSPIARKSAVDDHEILIGENHTGFIPQRRRHAPDQTEQSLASRWDVGAVLDVVRRPEPLGGLVVPLIEKRVERFSTNALFRSSIVCVMFHTPFSIYGFVAWLGRLDRLELMAPLALRREAQLP